MNNTMKVFLATAVVGGISLLGIAPAYAQTVTPTPTETTRATRVANAKTLALKVYNNRFLPRFTEIKSKIDASTVLGADAKATIDSKIATEVTWFTTKRDAVSSLNTVPAIKLNVADAKLRFINDLKDIQFSHIRLGFVISVENVINHFQTVTIPKINTLLTQVAAQGIDVTAERTTFAQAQSDLDAAKVKLDAVKTSTSLDEAKTNLAAARALIQKARGEIQAAITSLKAKLPKTTPTPTPTATPLVTQQQ